MYIYIYSVHTVYIYIYMYIYISTSVHIYLYNLVSIYIHIGSYRYRYHHHLSGKGAPPNTGSYIFVSCVCMSVWTDDCNVWMYVCMFVWMYELLNCSVWMYELSCMNVWVYNAGMNVWMYGMVWYYMVLWRGMVCRTVVEYRRSQAIALQSQHGQVTSGKPTAWVFSLFWASEKQIETENCPLPCWITGG